MGVPSPQVLCFQGAHSAAVTPCELADLAGRWCHPAVDPLGGVLRCEQTQECSCR